MYFDLIFLTEAYLLLLMNLNSSEGAAEVQIPPHADNLFSKRTSFNFFILNSELDFSSKVKQSVK